MNHQHVDDAVAILKALGFPRAQQQERSAYVVLALCGLSPSKDWSDATKPLVGITQVMTYAMDHYGAKYKPNTRETFRRKTMHQFISGGIAVMNPDDPGRAVNSPKTCYQVVPEALELFRAYGTPQWDAMLAGFCRDRVSLADQYAKARERKRVPVLVPGGGELTLSAGKHSTLIKQIIEEFGPQFATGSELIYAGDTKSKVSVFDRDALRALGVTVDEHGKMPDVVLYDRERHWLILVEAATSHGPVDGKRHEELTALFSGAAPGLVFVSAFPDRSTMRRYLADIAWETEVWVADAPTHMMHFNGERFLGPYTE